jgi:hypothetical protein
MRTKNEVKGSSRMKYYSTVAGSGCESDDSTIFTLRGHMDTSKTFIVGGIKNIATGAWWLTSTSRPLQRRLYEETQKTLNPLYGKVTKYAKTPFREAYVQYGPDCFRQVVFARFGTQEEADAAKSEMIKLYNKLGIEMY